MQPLDPNDPDNLVKLSQDDDVPDAPPDDTTDSGDQQQKDTNIEPSEVVDTGSDVAAGIDDPLRSKPVDPPASHPDEEGFDREP
jgi:hypothetical protein